MKGKNFILLFLFLPLGLIAQQKGFTITGTVSGVPDNSTITLTDLNNATDTLAKTIIKNGTFVLKGNIKEPNLHQLNFDAAKKKSILFIGNETITIKGNIEKVEALEVKGSVHQDDFAEFQQVFNPIVMKLTEMNQRISMTPNIQRGDSLMVSYMNHLDKIKAAIDKFVASKKTSSIAPFVILVTIEIENDIVATE